MIIYKKTHILNNTFGEEFMLIIFVLIIGLLVGSFLNVCIYRIPRNKSIVFPPSHCTNCSTRIKPYDLIPVISYIFLKGKCRTCGEKISIKYPIVELITGILFVLTFLKFGLSIDLIKFIILISILIIVSFIDFEYGIIPGKIMIISASFGVILNIISFGLSLSLLTYLYGLLIGGGVIFLIVVFTGGMGGGDIQLMAVIGLFLGFAQTILTLLLSFIIGAAVGIILILLKKKSRKDSIPFGPWISLAAILSIFLGETLIGWYLALFIS